MDDVRGQGLREAVTAVYAVPAAAFVAVRKEWVARLRADGLRDVAKEVAALRKPSVSAAALNALVHEADPVLDHLREVGTRLRHAQSALDAAGLAALRSERDALLVAVVAAARAHADGPLTASTEAEIRDTVVAALADAEATEVVLSGALTRSLSYSGFGEVDVADAVARTSTGVVLTRIEGGRGERAEDPPGEEEDQPGDGIPEGDVDQLTDLRRRAEEAEAEVASAREERRASVEARTAAQEQVDVADAGVAQARALLTQAEQHAERASRQLSTAADATDRAEEALRAARERRDEARARLEEAEDEG